jgi:predicted amidophosphoribosyltransferase
MIAGRDIERLARRRNCPRCSLEKTEGTALCRRCRYKLPAHMRRPLEGIAQREQGIVYGALRAAATYLDAHYRSIRDFGGGRTRGKD